MIKIDIRYFTFKIFLIVFVIFFVNPATAQDSTKSSVIKDKTIRFTKRSVLNIKPPTYQLLENYIVQQKAHEGDPLAQHELGIRFLIGKGFSADTSRAAYWIGKAAESNLASANFNLGIMFNNGWGVDWDPFRAYEKFLFAAERGMPEGQYAVGIFLTDNLVVKKNLTQAYLWIKEAAESGFEPALETLDDFSSKGLISEVDTNSILELSNTISDNKNEEDNRIISSEWNLDYLSFDTSRTIKPSAEVIDSALSDLNISIKKFIWFDKDSALTFSDSSAVEYLNFAAQFGSPEALTYLGRLYELGVFYKKNPIKAALHYAKALRFDSRESAELLWNLSLSPGFYDLLRSKIRNGDNDSKYIWSVLITSGFDNKLMPEQVTEFLESASNDNHIPSILELGLLYVNGEIVKKDYTQAFNLWETAKELGSLEAEIRIASLNIIKMEYPELLPQNISLLLDALKNGSLTANLSLGYAYENGISVKKNLARAVKYYRKAAERGSRNGYEALVRVYNMLRPDKKIFQVEKI